MHPERSTGYRSTPLHEEHWRLDNRPPAGGFHTISSATFKGLTVTLSSAFPVEYTAEATGAEEYVQSRFVYIADHPNYINLTLRRVSWA